MTIPLQQIHLLLTEAAEMQDTALYNAGVAWARNLAGGRKVSKAQLYASIISPITAALARLEADSSDHSKRWHELLDELKLNAIDYVDNHKVIQSNVQADAGVRRDIAVMFGDVLSEAA